MDTNTLALRLIVLVGILAQTGFGLQCYVCSDSKTNEECSRESDVQDCQDKSTPTTRYDTCMTRVRSTIKDGISIDKRCVVGPCGLSDGQNTVLGIGCDRSGPEWDCSVCCDTDRCNFSSAPGLHQSSEVFWLRFLFAAILSLVLAKSHPMLASL